MKLFSPIIFVLLCSKTRIAPAKYTDSAIFRQTFEDSNDNWDFSNLIQVYDHTSESGRLDYGHVLRVSYPPSNKGSFRVLNKFELEQVTSATLSYDVKFHRQFEFVLGGKLHGLGGGSTTTGCDPIDPDGWTVRLMWRGQGIPSLYVYHQDRTAKCGNEFWADGFKFERDQWYRVDLQVQMNTNPFAFDGKTLLYIDGMKLVEVYGLRFSENSKVDIDSFLFSTFYGGGTSAWSPSRTTYAYFDNFSVSRGLTVTGEQGTECELFMNGIYSPTKGACCAESCGSCGGSGCSDLPGGEWNCCSELIRRGHVMCDTVDNAPCKFEEESTSYYHQSPHLGPFDSTETTTTTTTSTSPIRTATTSTTSTNYEEMQQCRSYLRLANLNFFNMKSNNQILDTTEYVIFLNNLAKTLHPNNLQWIEFDGYYSLPDHLIRNFVDLSCICTVAEPNCCSETLGIYIGDGTDEDILDEICIRTLKEMEELRLEALKNIFLAP